MSKHDHAEGLYLVNSTGEMVPLHTASGKGDGQLLQEYLEERNLK